jgi:hypothetical protein
MKTVSYLIIAALMTLGTSGQAQGLVGHWKFDEGRTRSTADSSGNGNNGSLVGAGGPQWITGQFGNALRFDGADEYVNVPNSPSLGIIGDITMAAWIKREVPLAFDGIVSKTDGLTYWDYDFYFSSGDNRLRFWSDVGSPTPVFSSREVADTNWHHVAVTRSGSSVTFYIDGFEAGTTTMDGAFMNNAVPIRIGTDGPAYDPGSMFQGGIDEVRIYNRALTASEIQNLNVSGTGPEIVVGVNGVVLTSGDTTPSFADGTDFGVVNATDASVTRTFGIYNFGTATLTVGAVSISGANAADFTVTAQPAASIAAGGSTSFTIQFDPSGLGRRSATVSFANTDSNENPFTFAVQGSGLSTTIFPGFMTREVFNNIPGVLVSDLTSSPKYPNAPDGSEIIGGFEAPMNVASDFGQRIYGFLTPWETANYIFFIASDDQGELWLSTDENPANKLRIATEPGWTAPRDWSGTENRSGPILLEAGRRYFVEALAKEGGGGDHLAVTAIKEGDPVPENGSVPLQGMFVGSFGVPGTNTVAITTEPQSVSAIAGRTATFLVAAESSLNAIAYHWQKNGVNIFKATTALYTTPPLSESDSGAEYRCIALISSGATATSAVATVSVIADTFPPQVLRVHALADPITGQASRLMVVYDEPVEQTSAEDPYGYGIREDIAVTSLALMPNLKVVLLNTDPPLPASAEFYTLTVQNVQDRSPAENVLASSSTPFRITHLVAHYGFEYINNLGADSVGGNDGSVLGGPALVAGQLGNALNFDDIDDYVMVPNGPNFGITGDITLAAWLRRPNFAQYAAILAKTDGANTWDFDFQFEDGQRLLTFYSDGTSPTTVRSTNGLPDTDWHHVAVTRAGDTVTFYIDGINAGTATMSGAFPNNPNSIRIGTDGPAWDAGSMFNGSIDEVRIYNRALSGAQIQALMSPPRLSIVQSGNNVILSWPATALDYALESAVSLSPASWSVVPQAPVVSGGQSTVSLTIGNGAQFYRLKE